MNDNDVDIVDKPAIVIFEKWDWNWFERIRIFNLKFLDHLPSDIWIENNFAHSLFKIVSNLNNGSNYRQSGHGKRLLAVFAKSAG